MNVFDKEINMRKLSLLFAALIVIFGATFLIANQGEEVNVQETYNTVLAEIKTLEQSINRQTPTNRVMEVFAEVEEKLETFIAQFPGTDEAQDAKFQLGMLNANISNLEKSKQYLEDFIANSPNAQKSKMGYAHFFLAETFKNEEQFEDARKHLTIFLKEYGDIDPNLLARAKASLDDMEVLKKLTVGGEPIPFSVMDLEGKSLSLDKYKGKVVLLDFWATWCGPCRSEMPKVISLYNEYHNKGFEIVGISLDESRTLLEKYITENKMEWPQYFEGTKWDNSIARKYGVRAIPATFLLDREGKIRYKAVRGRELARAVEKLVSEK
jgi:thiol-disulfide isomerase/thioredoxin